MNTKHYLLGFDLGSSSVKVALVDADNGHALATAFYPKTEAPILSIQSGWAEQQPEDWISYAKNALSEAMTQANAKPEDVIAIGISYQMHGLVCVDKNHKPLRPSIIWCDSRAVPYGDAAFKALGSEQCLSHLLNSPGNFTAAKLAWVKENEPELFQQIDKIMLPGDYLALRLSGTATTTIGGLSEGMLWDFQNNQPATFLMDYFGFPASILPEIVPNFEVACRVSKEAASEFGLIEGTPITYRAGDQPNNALSLNVFNPGEIAATAGTSGVVYGVLGQPNYDPKSRVNTFAHVNHTPDNPRLGVLLCINGTGILNAWMKRTVAPQLSYNEANQLANSAPIGSDGVSVIPFGNGAERVLENQNLGASISGVNFNRHKPEHLLRAAQEGIAFSFAYGMQIMKQMGMTITNIHAGNANMFLSPIFRKTLASVSQTTIQLYDTDGSIGAAKAAGLGVHFYQNTQEAFQSLKLIETIQPDTDLEPYNAAYEQWLNTLNKYKN